uniref:CQ058 protein n=1 Tax=Callorhinchus milii TaxID=7868 RepID=A0A4W3K9D0_CALMI
MRLVTVLVDSDGFYRTSRLYVTPDGFFFKAHVLVVDTFNCKRPCPDLKFGARYIMMGQIYHRRYSLPAWVQERVTGRLKPGDGLVKSSSYVKRYNRKREQKLQAAQDGKCGGSFPGISGK